VTFVGLDKLEMRICALVAIVVVGACANQCQYDTGNMSPDGLAQVCQREYLVVLCVSGLKNADVSNFL